MKRPKIQRSKMFEYCTFYHRAAAFVARYAIRIKPNVFRNLAPRLVKLYTAV
jgi:hypothetical protein